MNKIEKEKIKFISFSTIFLSLILYNLITKPEILDTYIVIKKEAFKYQPLDKNLTNEIDKLIKEKCKNRELEKCNHYQLVKFFRNNRNPEKDILNYLKNH